MKIGFLIQATTAISPPGDGVRASAHMIGEALLARGHEFAYLNPWQAYEPGQCDVVQFFLGGLGFYGIEGFRKREHIPLLCYSPAIDSNEPFWRYRMAAELGCIWPRRILTIPGVMRQQALAAGLVVCRSTHERERVVRGLGVSAAKTEIVLLGIHRPTPADPALARATLGLPDEFCLHISRYCDDRKNVIRLIEAVGPLGLPLVIAGGAEQGPTLERIRSLVKQYPNVRLFGFQPAAVRESLYAACRVFCLPSLHEGVGLVALEAAAQGAKVVATSRGGPPDYFGRFVEYVDPYDVNDIRDKVSRAWRAPAIDDLKEHVLANLTWDHTALALLRAYERFLPRPVTVPTA